MDTTAKLAQSVFNVVKRRARRVRTKLAEVLGVCFSEFFVASREAVKSEGRNARTEKPSNVVVRTEDRQKLKLWRAGIVKQSLVP